MDEDVIRFDVHVSDASFVREREGGGDVAQTSKEVALGHARAVGGVDVGGDGPAVAHLHLYVQMIVFPPRRVVPNDVLTRHETRHDVHLAKGFLLLALRRQFPIRALQRVRAPVQSTDDAVHL